MCTYSVALYHRDGDYIGTARVEAGAEKDAGIVAIARLVGRRTKLTALYVPKVTAQQPALLTASA